MNQKLNKERFFHRGWLILLAIVLIFVVRAIWLYPRIGWSLKDKTEKVVSCEFVPAAASETIKHVLLISIDTCRADHLGCYGYSRNTSPNIDNLAADGILFNHAITPVPITLPSHSSMLTGTLPLYHRVRENNNYRLSKSNVTLAEILKENGFTTAAFVSSFVLDSQFGLNQGFDTYDDDMGSQQGRSLLEYNERDGQTTTDCAIKWLQEHGNEKFFLFIHFFDPHVPYEPHKGFRFNFAPLLTFKSDLYDGEIAYTDHCIGQVVKKLKQLGIYDSTLLIVTADHGESLGQHDEETHGYFIYHSTLHVPLIMKIPTAAKAVVINDLAGLIDIVPTVCSLLGISPPGSVQGKDLTCLLTNKDKADEERYLYCESLFPTTYGLGPFLGLAGDRFKYIHIANPELYDLADDVAEKKNVVIQNKEQTDIMQNHLRVILEKSEMAQAASGRMEIDEQTRKRLESLGYVSSGKVDENLKFQSDYPDPKQNVEVYHFSQKFMKFVSMRKFGKAKKLCEDMLAKQPEMIQIYYNLGLIASYEKDMDGIIKHFSRYLALYEREPNNFDMKLKHDFQLAIANANTGIAFVEKGQYDKALSHFEKAMTYNPYDMRAYSNLVNVCLHLKKLPKAVEYLTKGLEINPESPEIHFYLGNIYFEQKEFGKAVEHYKKAVALKPDWPEAKNNLRAAQAHIQTNEKTTP